MDDSDKNSPSEVTDEVREQIKAEVRDQLEEAESMGPVAMWFRIALIILLLIEWFVFGFDHVKTVLQIMLLLLQRFVET